MARRRRRIIGLIPRLGRGGKALARWMWRHPQQLLCSTLLAVVLGGLWRYVQGSSTFRVAHVWLPADSVLQVRATLIGTNLFDVDLRTLSEELTRQQPWLQSVRVSRQLPNTIRIEPIPRLPVAQVRIDRWYAVDDQGFLLPAGVAEPAERLVRFTGMDRSSPALSVGAENRQERLQLALRVLRTLRRAPPRVSRHLTELNVSDPYQLRFILDDQTEIRCGSELELEAALERLRAALRVVAKQPLSIQYIDVRFQEPVIGPRSS